MFSVTERSFEPYERIEFAFVLLPNEDVLQEVAHISETVISLLHYYGVIIYQLIGEHTLIDVLLFHTYR